MFYIFLAANGSTTSPVSTSTIMAFMVKSFGGTHLQKAAMDLQPHQSQCDLNLLMFPFWETLYQYRIP
jgi:hypothetical protein